MRLIRSRFAVFAASPGTALPEEPPIVNQDDQTPNEHKQAERERNPYASSWSAERPEHKQYDVHEGEYLPPGSNAARPKGSRTKGLGAIGAAIAVFVAKFKTLLLLLLNFKWAFILIKIFVYGGSFLISLWFYALFWGWKFALVFIIMLLVHELGHFVTIRNYGLPAKWPMFVPMLGAYTVGGVPESLEHDAYIALAGPLTGLGAAAACYGFGVETHEAFWYAAAYFGAFINLFNMIPAMPFDGGRIAGALSPALWVFGFVLFLGLSFALHVPYFFIILFGLLALPSAIAGFRGYVDPRYATMTALGRVKVALWYLGTLFALFYLMSISHVAVPHTAVL